MQTFAQKKIVLAVGASLMVMAGAAQAVAPAAFGARALKPVLATPALQANANALYAATGFTGTLPVVFNITAPADTTAPAIAFAVVTNTTLTINAANTAATTVGASVATDDIAVFAGTAGATQINLVVPAAGQAFTPNNNATSAVTVAFSITTAGNEALRLNPASGALEYTADKTAATIAWLPVSVATQVVAGDPIVATDSTVAPNTTNITPAAQSAFNTVAPAGTAKTRSTAGSSLVDGVVVDTVTPLTAAIVVGSATTGLAFTSNVAACSPSLTDANNAADIAAVAPTAPATGLTTAMAGSLNTITFAGATTDWTTGDATVDAAAYVSNCFNTGIASGSLPFNLAVTATAANLPTYALVYKADGTNQVLAALPAVTDAATPVIVTAANSLGTALQLTFSEQMSFIDGDSTSDLREIMENVFLSGTFASNSTPTSSASLAAIALNDGLNLNASIGTTAGQSTLTISGLTGGELTATSTVSVTTGITFKEANDTGYSATVPAIDVYTGAYEYTDTSSVALYGGVTSFSGAVEAASVTAKAVTPAVVTVDFDDTTAYAQTTAADPSKVGQIIVTFAAGKEISLASGLTTADLVNQIRVTVFNDNNWTESYQFFPTAAQMAVNTAGTQLTITLPTDQIYANIDSWATMSVDYLGLVAGNGALVKKASAAIPVASLTAADRVLGGDVNVKLPLSAQYGANAGLITQSIIGDFAQVTNGDRVSAFLAHWESAPKANAINLATLTGTISAPAGNSLVFGGGEEASLNNTIEAQLNAVAAAKLAVPGVSEAVAAVTTKAIPLYFVVADGVATLYDDPANAGAESAAIIDDINSAAADAGWEGSDATGADGSVMNNSGNGTVTTSVAALAAGSATAAAEVVSRWVDVPQATKMAAVNAAAVAGATPASVMKAVMATIADYKVKVASLDPVSGNITGGVTGKLVIKNNTTSTADRGLIIDSSYNADAIVGTVNGKANSFNLLVGVSPASANLKAAVKADEFVILVHESATSGKYTMLTSADPTAKNYLPFAANLLTGSGARTTLPQTDMTKIASGDTAASGSWTLMPLGNPAKQLAPAGHVASFDRAFVGLDNSGYPTSVWTNDDDSADMALAMVGSKATAATELGDNKATLSTITSASFIPGAAALAWKNDDNDNVMMYLMQATPVVAKVPAGWSLVTVPAAGTFGAAVKAVIKVGAQTSAPYTWVFGDTVAPALTAGEAVFVYSPAGGAL